MQVEILKNGNELFEIREDWDRLTKNFAAINSFEWCSVWWNNFKNKNSTLQVIVARKDDKVVGIAPLYTQKTRAIKFLPFVKLCFLGGDITDYHDFLIEDNFEKESVFKAIFECIKNEISFDVMETNQISSDYPNFKLWQNYCEAETPKFKSYKPCPKLITKKFESYNDLFEKMNKNLKRSLKYRQRKIDNDKAKVEYSFKEVIESEDIKIIGKLNIDRQKFLISKGFLKRDSIFADEQKNEFIKNFFCCGKSDARILVYMKVDDEIIAYAILFTNNKTIYYWNAAFNPAFDHYSPSKMLLNEMVKYAFANNYESFDFMRGGEKYKFEWCNETSTNYELSYRKSLKAKFVYLYRENIPEDLINKVLRNSDNKIKELENAIEI